MADREATCDWNCRRPFPHVGPCSPSPPCCGDPAPDRSTRLCDLAQGHDGDHWTYAGRMLKWPRKATDKPPTLDAVDPVGGSGAEGLHAHENLSAVDAPPPQAEEP